MLIVAGPFSAHLPAKRVGAALGRGLAVGGWPDQEILELQAEGDPSRPEPPWGSDDEERLRRSRAIVLATARLDPNTLRGSVFFALATNARQGGIPAFAVSAHNCLSAFDARMLDLQVVLEAKSAKALEEAGAKLGELL